ncbi:MAG: tRNA (adenosine(37)-N6)-threonylcarbamoyltransferase complex ATPase subunit type 1 TsaE [Firmicutes bacterium]|nr:tRNA (adenosine(37)-N6)-threonylcarbamoyltransferase complex ATPase subunit type 1 TsaE [Bacillota bacterium]
MKILLKTNNDKETFEIARSLSPYLKCNTNLLLDGDLAAGKTVFAKGIGSGLDVIDHIKSPSYTLLCMYEGRLPFYHFDAYNLNGMDDFYDLGFDEYLEGNGVTLIEWASVISDDFPYGYIHIQIEKEEDFDKRTIYMESNDEYHESILKEWQQHENIGL